MPLKPGQKHDYDICLTDGRSGQEWYLKLDTDPQRDSFSPDSYALDIRQQGKRIGDFDEQRSWRGGRGGEYFSDDPEGYFDSRDAWTMTGHIIPTMKWYFSTGDHRTVNQHMGDSVRFKKLLGATRYISDSFTATAQTADYGLLWIRRRGNPGTLTFELCSNSSGDPGSVLKTVTKTITDITDVLSELIKFDWSGTQALSGSTIYHVKVYGASTDNDQNCWEVGADPNTSTAKVSSDNSTWVEADGTTETVGTFGLHYRIADADTAGRWFFWTDGTNFFKVRKPDSGTSVAYKWNETNDDWDLIGGTQGLGIVTGRPVYYNAAHYIPQGEGDTIRRWDGVTTWADDGTNVATFLEVGLDPTDGPVIWRANTTPGTKAAVSRGIVSTNIVFNADINVGDKGYGITGIRFWTGNGLYTWKSNSLWQVSNDRAVYKDIGLEKTPSSTNGIASVGHQQFLYWNWLFSLERTYGDQTDDIGMGWKGPALPEGREGYVSSMTTLVGWMIYSIDAGATGISSVYVWDGLAHHEIFRAPLTGMRIRDVFVQPVSGARTRLWFDCGADTVYMEFPLNKANPLYDSGAKYHHEFSLTSSTIDMGTASKLPKFVRSLTATTANLDGSGIRIEADMQFDNKVGLDGVDNWIPIGSFLNSPEDTVNVNRGDLTQFRYRIRAATDDATTPPDIKGIVPSGFARTDFRLVWNLRVITITNGSRPVNPEELDDWILEASKFPGRIHMTSRVRQLHDYYVIIGPPRSTVIRIGKRNKPEKYVYSLSLLGAE